MTDEQVVAEGAPMWQSIIVAALVLNWGIGTLILGFRANVNGHM
jgi:hypothetical protein